MMLRCFYVSVYSLPDCLLDDTSVLFQKNIHFFCYFLSSIIITIAAMSRVILAHDQPTSFCF